MKIIGLILLSICILLFIGCPTPWGIIFSDQIIHWNGEKESIDDWLGLTYPEEEMVEVHIILEWE